MNSLINRFLFFSDLDYCFTIILHVINGWPDATETKSCWKKSTETTSEKIWDKRRQRWQWWCLRRLSTTTTAATTKGLLVVVLCITLYLPHVRFLSSTESNRSFEIIYFICFITFQNLPEPTPSTTMSSIPNRPASIAASVTSTASNKNPPNANKNQQVKQNKASASSEKLSMDTISTGDASEISQWTFQLWERNLFLWFSRWTFCEYHCETKSNWSTDQYSTETSINQSWTSWNASNKFNYIDSLRLLLAIDV